MTSVNVVPGSLQVVVHTFNSASDPMSFFHEFQASVLSTTHHWYNPRAHVQVEYVHARTCSPPIRWFSVFFIIRIFVYLSGNQALWFHLQ